MCGICGIAGEAPPGAVDAMVRAMRHRGPDDSGVFRAERIALGMTRLAVIDLSPRARQPMTCADGEVRIVYNGEIYNFRDERDVLARRGVAFASDSDTEVVLRMYERYGDDFLLRLRGMFALAIHDARRGRGKERILLARDPFGIKPLLVARSGSLFLFASEMKALLASGLVPREADAESLRLLLTFGSVIQPRTAVAGVTMLPAGHRLVLEDGAARLSRYWGLGLARRPELARLQAGELAAEVRRALEESVRLQMVSDVPVGAFLSGGVDSTLLVALMARESARRVKTFSVGFEADDDPLDETDAARRTALFIGTDHTRVAVTGSDVRHRLADIARALDQPSVDGVNSYFVARAARTGVTVAVSGTGGDELFAGYPWFIYMALAAREERDRPWRTALRRALAAVAALPAFDPLAVGPHAQALDAWRGRGFFPRYARITQVFGVRGARDVLSASMREASRVGREPARDTAASDELPGAPPVERVTALCLRGYTQNQLLRDVDATSMAHSLEVRVPFLDPRLVDLALSLPSASKLGGLDGLPDPLYRPYRETGAKRVLFDAARDLLPEGLDRQGKRGFRLPFERWLAGPLREPMEELVSPQAIRRRGLFEPEAARAAVDAFLAGRGPWTRPWLLMMVELWCREVLDASPGAAGG